MAAIALRSGGVLSGTASAAVVVESSRGSASWQLALWRHRLWCPGTISEMSGTGVLSRARPASVHFGNRSTMANARQDRTRKAAEAVTTNTFSGWTPFILRLYLSRRLYSNCPIPAVTNPGVKHEPTAQNRDHRGPGPQSSFSPRHQRGPGPRGRRTVCDAGNPLAANAIT